MKTLGIPSVLLMERAALSVSAQIEALLHGPGTKVLALCGPGNNGGDGLAIARQLKGRGVDAAAVLVTERHTEAVEEQLRLAKAYEVPVSTNVNGKLGGTSIVVDAMLGTGSRGAPRGSIAGVITALEGHRGPVIAVDVPSGVDPDTGAVPGPAVRAAVTVTFQHSKPGLHVTPGRDHAGRVVVADIGLLEAPGTKHGARLIDPVWVQAQLSQLPPGRHKGERGHLGLLAGSGGTPGAAVIAGAGALRMGAGLVTIASDDEHTSQSILATRPELMLAPREDPLLPHARALTVGPGLTTEASRVGLGALYLDDERPAVWDATGLDELPAQGAPNGPRIITPHPGEAARLLTRLSGEQWDGARVQSDRLNACQSLAGLGRAVAVLKGEATVVSDQNGLTAICVTGGPPLATAGSGDVLAGVIGALLARGLDAWSAACVGVHLHGAAGDMAGRRFPMPLAMDIADTVPHAFAACRDRDIALARWPSLRRG
jgi:NAD(P)H-hydrate epimerase